MRRLVPFLFLLTVAQPKEPARLSVAQLRDELRSGRSDEKLAAALANVELIERLESASPEGLGPRSQEALRILAAESAFLPAPAAQLLNDPPPDRTGQNALLAKARAYALGYVHDLPDFICKKTTRRWDDGLEGSVRTVYKNLRRRDTVSSELTFSRGTESDASRAAGGSRDGLTSFGEYGSMLGALFMEDSRIKTAWSHWELFDGARVAVFDYAVDSEHSRYEIVWCCYGLDGYWSIKTAYDGELFLDPDSGAILRVTRRAKPPQNCPTIQTDTAVTYRRVDIGGKTYLCPAKSVIVSTSRTASDQATSTRHYVNEMEFTEYRRFEASSTLKLE